MVRSSLSPGERTRNDSLLIGEVLVARGIITEHDVARIVVAQKETQLRFGETAVRLGILDETDTQRALALQFDYPYSTPGESNLSSTLACAYEPFGGYAEAVRSLRSQLLLRWFTDSNKFLAVVSPRDSRGNSVAAANLAISFAQLGERTLLLDANLRNGHQRDLFGVSPHYGLSAVLAGREAVKAAVVNPVENYENLSLICAGACVPNPQELLGQFAFPYLMEALPSTFDVVIVDTPAALQFADAQLIVAQSRGCIINLGRHETSLADVREVQMQLRPTGATVLGAVVVG